MPEVTIQDVGPCKKRLKITVPAAEVKAKVEANYEKLGSTVALDGFRKGHVPRKLIERRFGEEVVEEVKQTLLSELSEQAVHDHQLKILGTPSFDNVDFAPDRDFIFEITLEIEPEFELAEYKGLRLKRMPVEVGDADVEAGLQNIRQERSTLAERAEAEGAAAGDALMCEWRIAADAEEVAGEKANLVLAQGKRFAGVDLEQDLGEVFKDARRGDTRTVSGKTDDGYPVERLRNRAVTVTFTVRDIRCPVLPELTEEFAKSLDFASLDELREFVRASIRQGKERDAAMDLERQVFDALIAAMPFELPEGVLKAQARSVLLRQQYRLRGRGLPESEIEKHLDELRSASEEVAGRSLKSYFILNKIADKEKLFVTENEVQNRIAAIAGSRGVSAQKLRRDLEQEGSLAELRAGMREDKTLAFLLSQAVIE